MATEALVFDRALAPPSGAQPGAASTPPAKLIWSFNPSSGLDRPFHGLVSHFGHEVIMALDQIVLETPLKAAARATKVFQHFSAPVGRSDETRTVMSHLAAALKPAAHILDDVPLVPPEAVFHGFEPARERPRG